MAAATPLETYIAKNFDKDPKALLELVMAESQRIQAEAKVMAEVTFDERGFKSATMAGLWRLAQIYAGCQLVPEQYRGKPYDCFVAVQLAQRMGVDAFMLMQNSYVVHGRPGIEAKLAIALANKSGFLTDRIRFRLTGEGQGRTCVAYATDAKTGEVCEGPPVSLETAGREGWDADKGGRNGAPVVLSKWKTLPELMLRYRAAAFFIRTFCPEVLMGLHTTDELEDIDGLAPKAGERIAPPASLDQLADRLMGTEGGNGDEEESAEEESQAPAANTAPIPPTVPTPAPVPPPTPEPQIDRSESQVPTADQAFAGLRLIIGTADTLQKANICEAEIEADSCITEPQKQELLKLLAAQREKIRGGRGERANGPAAKKPAKSEAQKSFA